MMNTLRPGSVRARPGVEVRARPIARIEVRARPLGLMPGLVGLGLRVHDRASYRARDVGVCDT